VLNLRHFAFWFLLFGLLTLMALPIVALAQAESEADIEAEAWPEFDIWIGLDPERKNRIFILNSYSNAPDFGYQETALGISWDQRFSKSWSWRAGVRYVWKAVDPPDTNELRGVFDLKWFRDLGNGWLLTDRNRIDARWFESSDELSYRYRNRLQIEKSLQIGTRMWTGFASYELYFDTRFSAWSRRRIIVGFSVPFTDWLAVDLFYGYHNEQRPKQENAGAVGIAIGLLFYD